MTNVAGNAAGRRRARLLKFGIALLFVAITTFVLYPVVRDYYVAYRENSRLQAEYEAVLERNTKIQQQIENLQRPEGIEDRARVEFGWVMQGEEAVNITGLSFTESSTSLPTSVEPGTVMPPETWWTRLLDKLFGVEYAKPDKLYPDDVIPGL